MKLQEETQDIVYSYEKCIKKTENKLLKHRLKVKNDIGEIKTMKWERFSVLAEKEVINICDGKRLGCICDLEIDMLSGKVCTLIVPEEGGKFNLFGKGKAYFVPWCSIRRIGDDIILVEADADEILRDDG